LDVSKWVSGGGTCRILTGLAGGHHAFGSLMVRRTTQSATGAMTSFYSRVWKSTNEFAPPGDFVSQS
jgi:hypothetical protein